MDSLPAKQSPSSTQLHATSAGCILVRLEQLCTYFKDMLSPGVSHLLPMPAMPVVASGSSFRLSMSLVNFGTAEGKDQRISCSNP